MSRSLCTCLSLLRSKAYHLRFNHSYPRRDARMLAALTRFRECRERKPEAQIREELAASRRHWRCEPWFYYRYDLYRRERTLSRDELLRYIPEYFLFNLYFPRFNASPLAGVLDSKTASALFFRSLGIRCAQQVLFSRDGQLFDGSMNPLAPAQALARLSEARGRRIFFKPDDGRGGAGVRVAQVTEQGALLDEESRPFAAEELLKLLTGQNLIVELGLLQRDDLSAMYPNAVNTIRIASETHRGRSRIVFAALRLGSGGRLVDNVCQNGLALCVDVETGELQARASNQWDQPFLAHPDTGYVFQGQHIRDWPQVIQFVLDAAARSPFFRHVGWDIALTEDGPVAIEANLGYEIDLPQQLLGGMSELLGIGDPGPVWALERERYC